MPDEMSEKVADILSAKECEKVVRNALKLSPEESTKIVNYALEKGSNELVGFMGEYFKLRVQIADEQSPQGIRELCCFVKSVPVSNELQRAECERKNFFRKEICAYTAILPNIQKYATTKLSAECYYTRGDLLVLEDLFAAHLGYRHLASDEPYTNRHIKLFLTHLAQLHAGSIAWEEKEGVNIGKQFGDSLFELMLIAENEWYVTGAKGIIFLAKNYGKFQTPEKQSLINDKLFALLMDMQKYTEPSITSRNVYLHRDSWDRNIFFKFNTKHEPTACCIVDFQQSRYAQPGLDLLFFLYGQTTASERKLHMNEYIEHYFSALQARFTELDLPADIITKAELLEDIRRAHLPALVNMAITKPLTMMPDGLSNKWRAEEQEKFDYYMNTKRDEFFRRIMEMDPTYQSKIMWPIEELIEHLIQNPDLCQ
uniref:CHK kinase-like domain-containing protein n=1 Tax=Bactrocera latifrons TaxID=174628 RepID=A0A0K8VQP4_BACLA